MGISVAGKGNSRGICGWYFGDNFVAGNLVPLKNVHSALYSVTC